MCNVFVFLQVDDVVMVNVRAIAEMGAYVYLLEYNNIEGMILLSELSRRRIRSINKLIRVGKTEPVVVIRVDKEKGNQLTYLLHLYSGTMRRKTVYLTSRSGPLSQIEDHFPTQCKIGRSFELIGQQGRLKVWCLLCDCEFCLFDSIKSIDVFR